MRLGKTILSLVKAQRNLSEPEGQSRLSEVTDFHPNPGNLRGFLYVPDGLTGPAPLVVVLHGCTQNAAGYDQGSGWSRLAERHGFAVLFPEQQRSNNQNLCFNWFSPEDTQRGLGEAASIRSMIESMIKTHPIDPARIFVTGLSAGGAMTCVMLATYPDLFAGGAVIAGVPYGCASNLGQAFECMSGRLPAEGAELAASVRRASSHQGPWPRVSVWHGSEDRMVAPSNGQAIIRQWAELHGVGDEPSSSELVGGYPRRTWTRPQGEAVIEEYVITGMAHGTPLMPGTDEGQSGEAMAHMLDVGLSSTDRIASFFGIAPEPVEHGRQSAQQAKASKPRPQVRPAMHLPEAEPAAGVQKVIEDALRTAGLMR